MGTTDSKEQENLNKRPRKNCIIDNIVCASRQSPTSHRIGLIQYVPKRVSVAEFFPDGYEVILPSLTLDGSDGAPSNLGEIFTTISEDDMRNRLSEYLEVFHKIKLLGLPVITDQDRPTTFGTMEYHEKRLNTMFRDLPLQKPSRNSRIERFNMGLPVTGTSGGEMVVLRGRNMIYKSEPIMGEAKNKDTHQRTEGENQALLYCLTHMYDARVVHGVPVESVYGFAVNGPNVPGTAAYQVTLVRVRVASKLSNYHRFESCVMDASSMSDPVPLQTLIHFLKAGKRSSFPANCSAVPDFRRAPCRFVLPNGLWNSDLQITGGAQLFLSGTLAMAFRGSQESLLQIAEDYGNMYAWSAIRAFTETIPTVREYVLKIQDPLIGTNEEWEESLPVLHENDDLKYTYPIAPLPHGFIFMRYRGERVGKETFRQFAEFRQAFTPVWHATMHLCQYCRPSDTLPHNMVYDGTNLHLIDVDENFTGMIREREPPVSFENDQWLEALRYPDYFRENVWLYALIQLCYSVYVICSVLSMEEEEYKHAMVVEHSLKIVGKSLLRKLRVVNQGRRTRVNASPFTENQAMEPDIKGSLIVIASSLPELFDLELPSAFPQEYRP